ncbi:hypothetical protein [Jiulongibacter sediminis]|uniref:Outer membrane protein beta-barrel domain-containing protein n=1 Tax=Jiulongibacter sediminis TaxID=1605367 RepID=A0A0P7C2F0_9BACT|nr:hypothetical protein [Jiulongibacter sediminis]KPM48826.1 hypothetical protein AFM12_09645 [Jiulongibacter sediminis]TBX25357.1 hypothetical protein TK44_09650 [Jiulongibacter sediminis]
MNRITLLIFLLLPVIGLAQSKSQLNIGLTGGLDWGGVHGFRGHSGVNIGKFVSDGLVIGVSSEFSTSGYKSLSVMGQFGSTGEINNIDFVRNSQTKVSVYSKYYLTEGRVMPFLMAEVGGMFRRQAGSYDGETTLSNSLFSPHVAIGAGVSTILGKKRNTALELSYLLENSGRYPTFNHEFNGRPVKGITGQLNLGLQFFLK